MASNTKEEVLVDDMFIDDAADEFGGNAADRADMLRMGKNQELRVGHLSSAAGMVVLG